MKNNNLKNKFYLSIVYIILSVIVIIVALKIDSTLSSMLIGLSGGFFGVGLKSIYDYFYWSKPERQEEYEEKLDEIKRTQGDERLIRLREKSGRISYLICLAVSTISIWVIGILQFFNKIEGVRYLMLYLGGFLIFQLVIGMVVFNYLNKRY